MLDHINLPVSNLAHSTDFYRQTLSVLNMKVLYEDAHVAGFGHVKWDFGVELVYQSIPSIHVAFMAESQQSVQAFYNTALNCGGIDNGAPGLRTEYGSGYFAAYVLDFDGHNIEVVFRS